MIMGALFEVSVFLFIMQSTTILDVFLNFAALEFITSVDEFAFMLAQKGYISNSVKKACDEVSEVKILRRKGGRVCRRIQMVLFILAMMAAYAILANWQDTGRFECEKIEVQFGDGFSESLLLICIVLVEIGRSNFSLVSSHFYHFQSPSFQSSPESTFTPKPTRGMTTRGSVVPCTGTSAVVQPFGIV